MKKLYLLSLLLPQLLFAQLTDNFSDGDFINNPAWSGDAADFTIVNVFGNDQLNSNSTTASSNFYLSTPSALVNDCQWEFLVNLTFNTSGANYVDVYLTSDSANLTASNNNGYFVKIGNTDDEISLYKKVAGVSTKIIDGTNGVTNSSNNILKIKVTRNSTDQWRLEQDATGSGNNYVSEGTVIDSDVVSSSFFGVHITQSTASFFQKHFFDDFYAGAIIGDTTAPEVNSVTITSNTTLDVVFSEVVEKFSSESMLNYVVNNGIGSPSTAIRDATDSSIVQLIFLNAFQNGVTNILTITNVGDLNGNIIISDSRDFLFFIPDTAVERDVIVNEIFPDPDPTIGLPTAEFVEIFNRSNKAFDLDGWTFSDGSSTVTLGSFALLSGDYLILCSTANVGLFLGFGNTLGVGTLPSLNNSGDDLFLKDNTDLLLDHVKYSDTWYHDDVKKIGGWTLERIDENFPCDGEINWIASANAQGGTPGAVNSMAGTVTDNTPPQVAQFSIVPPDTIKLSFSEASDSASSVTLSNYFIDNGIGNPVSASLNGLEITLAFTASFNPGTIYSLIISGVTDCIGNILSDTFSFAIPQPASRFDILISEIFANPEPQVGLPEVEFVEIFNRSGKTISLENWSYSDASSSVTLPADLLLPDDYVILCHEQNAIVYQPFGKVLGLSSFPSLNNDSDELSLKDASGNTIFYVNYSDSWYRDALKQDGGWSLEMIDTDNLCSGADNWQASNDGSGGTPGQVNSVNGTNPDETSPSLNYALVQDSLNLILNFNETLDSTATSISNYAIDNGISIGGVSFSNAALTEVVVQLLIPLQRNIIYTLTVNGVVDCSGNIIGVNNTAQFGLPEVPDSFDIAINEILSNPVSGGSDFIELYNHSQKIIDLKDVIIATIDEEEVDTVATVISTKGFQLLPGNYVALTGDPQSTTAQYFTPNAKSVIDVIDMPSFDDDEDIIVLFNKLDNNSVIDAVHYYDDWNFALLDDLDGVSLERINYNSASQDKNNWHSAASTVGYATPAYQNSQFGESATATSEISIDPKTFSPNNDGYQDVLSIDYKLDQPGYVATIKIYDDEGREIRELVNNWLLDAEGSISWDGVNDDREKARIGVYIVIVELFDLSGDKRKFKESCVLAGKL